jgi:hypothetical protein
MSALALPVCLRAVRDGMSIYPGAFHGGLYGVC